MGLEDVLNEEMATYSSILIWKIREAWHPTVYRIAKSRTQLSTHMKICLYKLKRQTKLAFIY